LSRPLSSLEESRERCRQQLFHLSHELLDLESHQSYPVKYSAELEEATRVK
jgi:hypothetical protein